MLANATKTINFSKVEPKRLFVNEQSAEKDKKFVLHVTTHTPAKINISFN